MSTFGHYFRGTYLPPSTVSCIIKNCQPGLSLSESDIQPQLNHRRPGQSAITIPRDEKDRVTIGSGCEFGRTLGTPILLTVTNKDQRPHDYGSKTIDLYPRPSHADWTYLEKYGTKASSGGGRSSARETIARVAAGAVAEKWLRETYAVEIVAFISSVGTIKLFEDRPTTDSDDIDSLSANPRFLEFVDSLTRDKVDEFLPVRCPDATVAKRMEDKTAKLRDQHDSTGGTPCFDKLEALLAHAIMSIPATKGFEIGSGFRGAEMRGSRHNDLFVSAAVAGDAAPSAGAGIPPPRLQTKTNHSGGIQGGISNGMPIFFSVAFKPPATISQDQITARYDASGEGILAAKGRHDPNVAPRAVPIVEAVAALTIADVLMAQHARQLGMKIAAAGR
ncbi:chorismate synthase [Colletotrichum somersetense]|nr:chorismate synthase [Colletotrichum somersetense]